MADRSKEVAEKIALARQWLADFGAGAIRLRGSDWFSWATAGGSCTVLMAAETGVAEILITADQAFVLTDAIEAERLANEEVPPGYEWHVAPWIDRGQRDRLVQSLAQGGPILSDRPLHNESALPRQCLLRRWRLCEPELERYRRVGRLAVEAMTEVMHAARPEWSEFDLAGAGALALWRRGLHPALTLAAGENRLPRYRHPTATGARLGNRAMLVFCARGFGLYANLTRFVQFAPPQDSLAARQNLLYDIEAAGLAQCRVGSTLSDVYRAFELAYREAGFENAIREHHQGGITAYLAREAIAMPDSGEPLEENMAVAFNPSLVGCKVEDSFLLRAGELENLTEDPMWPSIAVHGRSRPLPLEPT